MIVLFVSVAKSKNVAPDERTVARKSVAAAVKSRETDDQKLERMGKNKSEGGKNRLVNQEQDDPSFKNLVKLTKLVRQFSGSKAPSLRGGSKGSMRKVELNELEKSVIGTKNL